MKKFPNFYCLSDAEQNEKSFFTYIRKGIVFELCIQMNYFTESTDNAPDLRKEISQGEYTKVKNKKMIKKILRFLKEYKQEEDTVGGEDIVEPLGYCC